MKMALAMTLELLPYGERPVIFLDQVDVVDVSLLVVMNDKEIMGRRGPMALLVNLALDTPCLLPVGLET
jgi:hypothetical protein